MLANFQGPFSLHAVIARALKVPGNRLRLRTPPDSGGSFGVKQGVFPYIVLIALAARVVGPAGEMDRGPAGASRGIVLRDQPGDPAVGGGGAGRTHRRAGLGPARGLRRPSSRAGAGHAVPHARQHDRRLRHPQRIDPQPGRADQQDADRAQSRLRRTAGVFRAGTPDAAHRGDTGARSARGHPAQPGPGRRVPVSHGDRRAARFRRLSRGDGGGGGAGRGCRAAAPARCGARGGKTVRNRLRGGGGAQRLQHGLHHHRADAGGTPARRAEERRAGDRDGGARSAGRRVGARRVGAAGAGASDRARPGGGRRVRPAPRGRARGDRAGYRQGRLVDRLGQLFQSFRRRGGGHGAPGRGAAA